jgi:hypothetical protein
VGVSANEPARGQMSDAECAREKAEKNMESNTTQREYETLD